MNRHCGCKYGGGVGAALVLMAAFLAYQKWRFDSVRLVGVEAAPGLPNRRPGG